MATRAKSKRLGTRSTSDIELTAKLLRGFADPKRLAILLELSEGEKRVTDLVAAVGSSQANVSGHLACLKKCGLVSDRPEARQVFYRISSQSVIDVLRSVEALLAVHGYEIDLCHNTRAGRMRLERE